MLSVVVDATDIPEMLLAANYFHIHFPNSGTEILM